VVKKAFTRLMVALTLPLGRVYVGWRWAFSVNWGAWWIAVPLVLAETYALVLHADTSTVGTAVNIAWVGYDVLVISIIYRAALYRAPEPTTEAAN
jgi:hypothetical protein